MSPTRRHLLAGVAGGLAGLHAGGVLYAGAADADFESWEPAPGTWPMPRYGPANTAYSPDATPPRSEPTVERVGDQGVGLVGTEYVTSGGDVPLLTRDFEPVSGLGDVGRPEAFGPPDAGVLYTADRDDEDVIRAVSLEGEPSVTDERRVDLDFLRRVVPGRREVYADGNDRTVALNRDLSSRGWHQDVGNLALHGKRLYAVGSDGLTAYEERTGLDRRLESGPEQAWAADLEYHPRFYGPAVADGRAVLVANSFIENTGVVGAYDAATGDPLWEPHSVGERRHHPPALVGDRAYVAVEGADLDRGSVNCVDAETGETQWSHDVDYTPEYLVAGGDTVVVSGHLNHYLGGDPECVLAAYDLGGEALWQTALPEFAPVRPMPVDDRLPFTGEDGLYAAR